MKEVTLTVAECSEFHNAGKYYENIADVNKAVALFKKLVAKKSCMIPAIGINVHEPGTEDYEDVQCDIVYVNRIDLDMLQYFKEITSEVKARELIEGLVSSFPDVKITGTL